MPGYCQPIAPRLFSRVEKPDGDSGCWLFTGADDGCGYGQMSIKSHPRKVHRVAYELANGPIDWYLPVLHSCNNRRCVNIAHLFLGKRGQRYMEEQGQDVPKKCTRCGKVKTGRDFYFSTKVKSITKGRLFSHCKKCHSAFGSIYYAKNPEKHRVRARDTKYRKQYKITNDDYDRMLANQGGVCKICETAGTNGKRLSVDHDHVSGSVRSLLCAWCNIGIGQFRDSQKLLIRAAEYLGSFHGDIS